MHSVTIMMLHGTVHAPRNSTTFVWYTDRVIATSSRKRFRSSLSHSCFFGIFTAT